MFSPEMSPSGVFSRALLLAIVLIVPASARAEDGADGLIKQGVELRRAGKDQAALEQFRRAYDLEPTPRALAQMGLAEQALGRWVDGEAHLARALEAAQDPWIAKYRATLEGSRAEVGKHLGSLSVTGGPAGAELRVDGRPAGTLPLRRPLRLPLGTFSLEASVDGRVVVARAVNIAAGITTREDLSPAAPPPDVTAPPPAPAASVETREPRATYEPTPDAAGPRRQLAWLAAGGAAALAGAGGLLLYLGDRNATQYGACTPPASASCESLKTTGSREQVAGVTGLVLGGAVGATAAVLFLTSPAAADGRVACAPALDRLGASCALRF